VSRPAGAERDPARVQSRRVENLTYRRRRHRTWRPRGSGHDGLYLSHHRPAIGPCHGGEVCLASEHMPTGGAAARPHPEQDHPPGPVRRLDQISVAGVLDRPAGAAVSEDRIGRAWRERPVRCWAPGDRHAVTALSPSLGDEQVPVIADLVQVRSFRVLGAGRAGPEAARLAERAPGLLVDADLLDPGIRAPAVAVVIPGKIGVDTCDAWQADWLRPGPGRVGGGEQYGAAPGDIGGDQPEPTVVVAQRRGVDTAG
jgi:hypothetical protein